MKQRNQAYWQRQCKRDDDLIRIFEERDKSLQDALVSRDQLWLDSLDSFNEKLKSMYYAQVDMGKTMGSLALRQVLLIKSNVKMLDWAMASASNKKNITAPKVTISDYIHFVIQPPYEHAIQGPLVSLEPTKPQKEQKKKKRQMNLSLVSPVLSKKSLL